MYIDPGAGAGIIMAIAGFIALVPLTIGRFRKRIKNVFKRK
jgi:hypothetical protein